MDYFTLEEINLMSPQNCLARLVSCHEGAAQVSEAGCTVIMTLCSDPAQSAR
jgi:hypothetical protein